jgi:HTH-type transcriptional regulator / antitoxin HipB
MHVRTPIDIGFSIRDRRRRLNLGQEELAARVGVSRKWIIDVEKGKPRAEIGLVLRTLDALGLRLALDDEEASAGPAGFAEESSPGITGYPDVPAVDIDSIVDGTRRRK